MWKNRKCINQLYMFENSVCTNGEKKLLYSNKNGKFFFLFNLVNTLSTDCYQHEKKWGWISFCSCNTVIQTGGAPAWLTPVVVHYTAHPRLPWPCPSQKHTLWLASNSLREVAGAAGAGSPGRFFLCGLLPIIFPNIGEHRVPEASSGKRSPWAPGGGTAHRGWHQHSWSTVGASS